MTDDDELVVCLICGKQCHSLGHHVRSGHGLRAAAYREQFGLRPGVKLTSPAVAARFAAAIGKTIASGKLEAHFATNGERASEAAAMAKLSRQAMRDRGLKPPSKATLVPRATIAGIVLAVEAGVKVATAVKRSGISYTAYHAGLARHRDLKDRHDRARSNPRVDISS